MLLNDGTWPAADAPSITVNDVTVTEGNTGTTAATFTVSLSAAYGQPVSVHYATADGGATAAGSDYQAAVGDADLRPRRDQPDHHRAGQRRPARPSPASPSSLRLTYPTNAFVADATRGRVPSWMTSRPSSIVRLVSGAEGNSGTTPFTFTVTLSAAYDVPVTVDYETADLTSDEVYYYGLTGRHGRHRLHGRRPGR